MKLRQTVVTANGPIVRSDTTKWFHSRELFDGSCVTTCNDTGGIEKSQLIFGGSRTRFKSAFSTRRSPTWNILLHYPYRSLERNDKDVAKGCSRLVIGEC